MFLVNSSKTYITKFSLLQLQVKELFSTMKKKRAISKQILFFAAQN